MGSVKTEPADAVIPSSPTNSSPRSAGHDSNPSQPNQVNGKRRRINISALASIPPHRPDAMMEDPPVSPIVMGFDAQAKIDDPSTRDTMLKSLDLKREQEALIQARRAEPRRAGFACVRVCLLSLHL
jgi:hypothetical protein